MKKQFLLSAVLCLSLTAFGQKVHQLASPSGNIRISDGWNINFSSGYDFDNHKMSMTTASMEMNMDIRTVTDAPAAHTETMTKRKKASI